MLHFVAVPSIAIVEIAFMNFSVPRAIFWCVTLAGAIVICLYGVEESKLLTRELNEVIP